MFSSVLFSAWGYEVTLLESFALLLSLIAVTLGAIGARITWPWWIVSSSAYGAFFYTVELYASALLQLVFITAALWGWFGWKPSGVEPRNLKKWQRLAWVAVLLITWGALAPVLGNIGAAASWPDSLLLVSSTIAQVLMVLQKNEAWILWFVINIFGTWHYANLGYWFTSLLYFIFTFIAVAGWVRWLGISRKNDDSINIE
jgi:nicotinamide mononucleotide transporter